MTLRAVAADKSEFEIPIGKDGLYRILGPLGESVVEVRDDRVRMNESPCPNKICVRQGWKDKAGQVIICAPNRVGLFLKGDEENIDAVSR